MPETKRWARKKAEAKADAKTALHFQEKADKPAKAGKKKSPLHSNPRSAEQE